MYCVSATDTTISWTMTIVVNTNGIATLLMYIKKLFSKLNKLIGLLLSPWRTHGCRPVQHNSSVAAVAAAAAGMRRQRSDDETMSWQRWITLYICMRGSSQHLWSTTPHRRIRSNSSWAGPSASRYDVACVAAPCVSSHIYYNLRQRGGRYVIVLSVIL